jgi:ligand-binding sensor domain-containing protein
MPAAQVPPPKHYNFTHYIEPSGLLSYQVRSIVQDEEGYIWIAVNDGLQRYDGIRYKNFRYSNGAAGSMPSKGIQQLLLDAGKNLWFLTNDGKAGILDTKTFIFHTAAVNTKNETALVSSIQLKKIIADDNGNVFLLMPGLELLTYNRQKNEFSSSWNFISLPPGSNITCITKQPGTDKYWMGLGGAGLALYDKTNHSLSYPGHNTGREKAIEELIHINQPNELFFDRNGRLWIAERKGTDAFVSCYDVKKEEIVLNKYPLSYPGKTAHAAVVFLQQKDGTVWAAGINILARFLEKEKQFQQVFNGYIDDRSIDYVTITSFIEDREHNLWAGTANNGLFRFNPAEEYFLNVWHLNPQTGKESDNSPISFMHLKDGSILTGIWNEPLIRYNKNFDEIPLGIKGLDEKKNKTIASMYASADSNTIWMAASGGIIKYTQYNNEAAYYSTAFLNSRLREIIEDAKGNVWAGTDDKGIYKYAMSTGKPFAESFYRITSLPEAKITRLIKDKKGYIWVAASSAGVYMIDPVTEKPLLHLHQKAIPALRLPEPMAISVLEYSDSLMIIATTSHLVFYNRILQKIVYTSLAERISGNIASMEKDKNGYLWISTSSGLYRVMTNNRVYIKFNREDGIRNDYFIVSASHVLPDGRILLGSSATMVVFNPAAIQLNTSFSSVKVTDFKVMNRSLRVDSLLKQHTIELPAGENSVAVDLSTLSFNTGYALKYRLHGLEKDWKYTDKTQQIVYPFLPPGKYTLLVTTIDADGKENKNPLQLSLKINPPFWKTWWFYSLLVLSAGGFLFWLDRERMKRKESLLKMRTDIARNLHHDVSTALSNINILSEMARLKADNDPVKSKEFIEQIHGKSFNMITAMDDMLWSIDPENDSMQKTVLRMKEYVAALNSRHNSSFEILVDEKVDMLNLNMQLRHEAFLLFKESMNSLVKAGASGCKIHVRPEKNSLLYAIEFRNACCDMQQVTNLLHSQAMKKRADSIKSSLNVDIQKTTALLTLKVPVL